MYDLFFVSDTDNDDRIKKLFSNIDKNKDSYLSAEEFEKFYIIATKERPYYKDWENFMKCERNDDNKVNIHEFIDYLKEHNA